MRARTLALLVCLAVATLLFVGPAVGTGADGPDADATTPTNTTTPQETVGTPSPTEVGTPWPRSEPDTNDGARFEPGTSSRRTTTTEFLGPGPDQPRGTRSAWSNAVAYLFIPGAVLGLVVGAVDSLVRKFAGRGRRFVRGAVGLGGVAAVGVAAVRATVWPLSDALTLGGLGLSCAVVALADRRDEASTTNLRAAVGAAVAVLAVAVGAATVGATPRGPGPVVVAAPGLGAAALVAVGTVAADRGPLTGASLSVLCYWAGAVAAGTLASQAQGMGAGLMTIALVLGALCVPVIGAPLYVLGVTADRRGEATDSPDR